MTTKAKCAALAKKIGACFTADSWSIQVTAPDGMCFYDGRHYDDWPVGEDYTKAEIYASLYELMQGGVGRCDCDECKKK